MIVSFFISKRYFFSLKNNNVVNIISAISIVGVMVSTIAMFIVLSVFSGLEDVTTKLFSVFDSDIKISPKKGKFFYLDDYNFSKIKEIPNVKYVSKCIEDKVLIKYKDKETIAYIKGVEEDFIKKKEIKDAINIGDWFSFSEKIPVSIMGITLFNSLGIARSEYLNPVKIVYPNKKTSISANMDDLDEMLLSEIFFNKGTMNIDKEVNSRYILTPLKDLKNFFNTNEISFIEVELEENIDEKSLNEVKKTISNIMGNDFDVKTVAEQNDFYFKMLNTERLMSFGILFLIMIIALFNIIGSITMLILDKKENILTLKRLGMKFSSLRRIFIYQGVLITVTGSVVGIILSSIFVYLQTEYGFIQMNMSGLSYPLKFEYFNFFTTIVTILILGIISSFFSVKIILKTEYT